MPVLIVVIAIVLFIIALVRGASVIGHRWRGVLTMVNRVLRRWMVPITVTGEARTNFSQALLVFTRVLIVDSSQLILLGVVPSHLGVLSC
jgi:hypothetical protein